MTAVGISYLWLWPILSTFGDKIPRSLLQSMSRLGHRPPSRTLDGWISALGSLWLIESLAPVPTQYWYVCMGKKKWVYKSRTPYHCVKKNLLWTMTFLDNANRLLSLAAAVYIIAAMLDSSTGFGFHVCGFPIFHSIVPSIRTHAVLIVYAGSVLVPPGHDDHRVRVICYARGCMLCDGLRRDSTCYIHNGCDCPMKNDHALSFYLSVIVPDSSTASSRIGHRGGCSMELFRCAALSAWLWAI